MTTEKIIAVDYPLQQDLMLMDFWRRQTLQDFENTLSRVRSACREANALRVMHDFHAWQRSPRDYVRAWEGMLTACEKQGFLAIPCLFNRWHDVNLDVGGIYLEQLIPDLSWAYQEGFYQRFLEDVMLPYADDTRILLWDACNKPLGVYPTHQDDPLMARFYELRWLRDMYCYAKKCRISQPIALSIREDHDQETLSALSRCCDLYLLSPYLLRPDKTKAVMQCRVEGKPIRYVHEVTA